MNETPSSNDVDADSTPFYGLDPDTVIRAVESTERLSDARVLALNSYENRVYQVGIEEAEPVIAKFYRPGRWSDAQILEEHDFTRTLAEAELPVVAPLADSSGATLHHFEGARFSLYPRRAGRAPDIENPDTLLSMGRAIGRIHAIGAIAPFAARPTLGIAEFGHASRDFLLGSSLIPEVVREAWESLTRDLLAIIERDFPALDRFASIRLHGDCHMGNVLWRGDEPNFVDFDDARSGPAVQDLWLMLSGERSERIGQLSEIVEGYDEFHDFSPAELVLVEPLRTLRILHHAAWIGRRWSDPAFPRAFPFFEDMRYWSDHVLALREQLAALQEPPLALF